jgi:hypothetical protein
VDARGLIAFIVTVHQVAALLALLVATLVTLAGLLLLRHTPPLRRAFLIGAFAVGAALITFGASSRLFEVRTLDVEVVRVSD